MTMGPWVWEELGPTDIFRVWNALILDANMKHLPWLTAEIILVHLVRGAKAEIPDRLPGMGF